MAKSNSINISDTWIDPNTVKLPPEFSVTDLEELLIVKPIKVSLEVVLPNGASAKAFDYDKNPEIKKFKSALESKAADFISELLQSADPKAGKKTLDALNSYLEKATKAFRVVLRTAVAKAIGGGCKPDDLMTSGSINFDKIKFLFGNGQYDDEGVELLDLTKAFKRVKKIQEFGIAWKANKAVVSVRVRKPFKESELKELREQLPDGYSQGAQMQGGKFFAFSKGKVEIRFDIGSTAPHEILMRKAFKKQTGQSVHTNVVFLDPKDNNVPEVEESKEKVKSKKEKSKSKKEKTKSK